MGSQQFLHMAQHHAIVNSAHPPSAPAYLPLHADADFYSTLMQYGQYNAPQHFMFAPVDGASAEPHMSSWNATHLFAAPAPVQSLVAHPSMANTPGMHSAVDVAPQSYTLPTPSYTTSSSVGTPSAVSSAKPAVSSSSSTTTVPTSSVTSALESVSEHISDAPFADEHKWRKYGQKQVKRSPYPRNYYKCTIPGCPAKKHLEKFWDAPTSRERCRTIYIGDHVHPVAVSPQVFASTQLDFQTNVLAQSQPSCASDSSSSSSSSTASQDASSLLQQQRLVVECGTQVDENEDGFSWRKYGQKSVKGSSTPRQYYRCRVTNCPVKKTVEASLKGNTIVTYDGHHTHEPGTPFSPSPASSPTPALPASPSPAVAILSSVAHPLTYAALPEHLPTAAAATCSQPESPSASSTASYHVESPGSHTTFDEEESYFSEPSPKRAYIKSEDVNDFSDEIHQFAPDAPWYLWDSPAAELLNN